SPCRHPRGLPSFPTRRSSDLLRETGLVALVVAVAPVPHQIDQHVATELHPVAERQARRLDARFGIVGVDVEDRNLEAAREPARRSEEHTSELQSRENLVCRLL